MSAVIFAFLAGMTLAVVTAFLVRWVATAFVSEKVAPYVAFAFTLGASSARAINSTLPTFQIAAGIGGIVGLVMVWWLFFKRAETKIG